MATALSLALWIAALACLTGCVVPAFASGCAKQSSCAEDRAADSDGMDMMAGMASCPDAGHHRPAKPQDGKSVPGGGMSCCFLNVDVPAKMHAPVPQLLAAHVAVPVAIFNVTQAWTHSAQEFSPLVFHEGRDTLLQTHLLRI